MEEECKHLGEEIAASLAMSPQGASGIANGPFPIYVAKLADVHLAEERVQKIRSEMKELHDQLALVALLNNNINVEDVVSSVTSDMNAHGKELEQQVS